MLDEAKYLFIRLCLRDPQWIRLSLLKYQSEIGDKIPKAMLKLCVKNEEAGELEGKSRDNPYSATFNSSSDASNRDYSFLAEDESGAELRDLLECLTVAELKQIAKAMTGKPNKKVSGNCLVDTEERHDSNSHSHSSETI